MTEREVIEISSHPARNELDASTFVSVLNRVFARLDANHDRVLQPAELDQAVVDHLLTEDDAEAVAVLKAGFEQIRTLHKEGWFARKNGITLSDLLVFEQLILSSSHSGSTDKTPEKERRELLGLSVEIWRRMKDLSRHKKTLWATGNPLDSIKPEAIRQGIVGDCYFLAALCSVAAFNPETIRRMVKEQENNRYTVTFPGDREIPVTVEEPSDVELVLYAQLDRYGIWPCVLEKAYGQYLVATGTRPGHIIPQDVTHAAAHVYEAFDLITGQLGHWEYLPQLGEDEIRNKLRLAIKERRAVAAATCDSKTGFTASGIPALHAYSVLGFSPERNTITLRNPWGRGRTGEPQDQNGHVKDGKDDGVFDMTMDRFRHEFMAMYYEDWLPEEGFER